MGRIRTFVLIFIQSCSTENFPPIVLWLSLQLYFSTSNLLRYASSTLAFLGVSGFRSRDSISSRTHVGCFSFEVWAELLERPGAVLHSYPHLRGLVMIFCMRTQQLVH